jgi:hypothetical protein
VEAGTVNQLHLHLQRDTERTQRDLDSTMSMGLLRVTCWWCLRAVLLASRLVLLLSG